MRADGGASFGTTIAPWLAVRDAQEAVGFYADAFGALEEYRLQGDDGRVAVARLVVGGAPFGTSTFGFAVARTGVGVGPCDCRTEVFLCPPSQAGSSSTTERHTRTRRTTPTLPCDL